MPKRSEWHQQHQMLSSCKMRGVTGSPKPEPTSWFQAGVTLLHWGAEVLCSRILLFAQPLPLSQGKWVVSDTSSHLFCHQGKQHRLALLLGWRWLSPEDSGAGSRASAPCSNSGGPREGRFRLLQAGKVLLSAGGNRGPFEVLCQGKDIPFTSNLGFDANQKIRFLSPPGWTVITKTLGSSAPLLSMHAWMKGCHHPVNAPVGC